MGTMNRWLGRCAAIITVVLLVPPVTPAQAAAVGSPEKVAAAAYARMTTSQRVGQLLMGMVPAAGSTSAARHLLSRYDVGNVVLIGQSYAGATSVATRLAGVRRATKQAGVRPFLAVDQEGGEVQHLKGPGFSAMPTALRQGRLEPGVLRARWTAWAAQLRAAGVNLDLAPVADVVPATIGTANEPIGRYHREYGHTPAVVAPHVDAAVRGIRTAGIGATVKHFPGLGRATGNTDTTPGVTDPTTSSDPYLAPFQAAVNAGAAAVMVSTAIYPNIDPGTIGAFSHPIVTTLLRRRLGFTGVIVSDSLTATALDGYSYASRAVRALDAGVDLLLVTRNRAIGPMADAIARRMTTDAPFASVVKSAVLSVLTAKVRAGLIT